jgi:RNA polymerase sigma-70 factor (ECF subfamily)
VLRTKVDGARAAWPELDLSVDDFLRHLAERLPGEAEVDLLEVLRATHAADLYLACGCVLGNTRALAAFDHTFISQVSDYLARRDSLPGFSDEVKQVLRTRLLVAPRPILPRISGYNGRGPLGGWLRMAAARAAIDLKRADARDPAGGADAAQLATAVPDPELSYLKSRHATELRQALEATLAALAPREATILRLHFLQGMSTEAIGKVYGAAERTARRWIAETRAKILEQTRERLGDILDVPTGEVDTLMRLLRDDVGPSILRVLLDDKPAK